MNIPTQMAWRPNLTPAEQCWRAHLQLQYWRQDGNPDKIGFWYLRRDELLEQVERTRTLAETFPELDAQLRVNFKP